MNNMPKKLREECAQDPFYARCARQEALHDHTCVANPVTGKLIEWHHALVHAGKQIQAKPFIIPLCWWAHEGPGKSGSIALWIALNRAQERDILAISRAVDYFRVLAHLNAKYGVYPQTTAIGPGIRYPWLEPKMERTEDGYTVIRGDDGTISCNCMGHVYRGSCKHASRFVGEAHTAPLNL